MISSAIKDRDEDATILPGSYSDPTLLELGRMYKQV